MKRVPEAELMSGAEQAVAYARADFSEPNNLFIENLLRLIPKLNRRKVLDLGCGPGDICMRLAERFPRAAIEGIDGSAPMLDIARRRALRMKGNAPTFHLRTLPDKTLAASAYDVVVSNSLLHHLRRPQVLWDTVKQCGKPGCHVLVMDLSRPPRKQAAVDLVNRYAADEPGILKKDFYNSLLSAFTLSEVEDQLAKAALADIKAHQASDRHIIMAGRLPG